MRPFLVQIQRALLQARAMKPKRKVEWVFTLWRHHSDSSTLAWMGTSHWQNQATIHQKNGRDRVLSPPHYQPERRRFPLAGHCLVFRHEEGPWSRRIITDVKGLPRGFGRGLRQCKWLGHEKTDSVHHGRYCQLQGHLSVYTRLVEISLYHNQPSSSAVWVRRFYDIPTISESKSWATTVGPFSVLHYKSSFSPRSAVWTEHADAFLRKNYWNTECHPYAHTTKDSAPVQTVLRWDGIQALQRAHHVADTSRVQSFSTQVSSRAWLLCCRRCSRFWRPWILSAPAQPTRTGKGIRYLWRAILEVCQTVSQRRFQGNSFFFSANLTKSVRRRYDWDKISRWGASNSHRSCLSIIDTNVYFF